MCIHQGYSLIYLIKRDEQMSRRLWISCLRGKSWSLAYFSNLSQFSNLPKNISTDWKKRLGPHREGPCSTMAGCKEKKVKSFSHVRLFTTPWTVARQAPLSMGFSRQEYWSGLPFPSPGDLPIPGIKPGSPALQADALSSEPPEKPWYLNIPLVLPQRVLWLCTRVAMNWR